MLSAELRQAHKSKYQLNCGAGYQILQVVTPGDGVLYFAYDKFIEPTTTSAVDIQFATVIGVNITNFIENNQGNFYNLTEMKSSYEKFWNDNPVVRCEFSKNVIWFKWLRVS